MANPTTYDFTTLVRNQITAIQAGAAGLIDTAIGSVIRAMVESNSAVILWLQGLILTLLATTRAATSGGTDLDSWVADYGVARLAAVAATGQVTFARFTAAIQATVSVGAVIQSGDGTQQFLVVADSTQSAWNAALGAYIIPAGTLNAIVAVQAATAGTGGNMAAGQINTLTQAMPGIDTVSNAAALTNGAAAESDAALRTRFVAYIASLAKATKGAIAFAIASLKQGVTYTLVENYNYGGAWTPGYFYAVVDDGTGAPSSGFISSAYAAIDAVRGFTIQFGVFAPVVITANIGMTITTAAGYNHSTVVAAVQGALRNYVNTLGLGNGLTYSRLAQVAYDASPGAVTNVTGITLNGGTGDVAATAQQTIKAGTVTIA